MQKQIFTKHTLTTLAIASLSTSLLLSCHALQIQDTNSPPQLMNSTLTNQPLLTRQDTFVTSDPGSKIAVRKVQARQNASELSRVPILLIHGGGPGSITSFDLQVPGYSLAADLAKAGRVIN